MFGMGRNKRLKAVCVTASDCGLVRKANEDHVFVDGAKTLFVVADGMGGGSEGATASRFVCEALEKVAEETTFVDRMEAVDAAIRTANDRIRAYAKERNFTQMGSTVAVLVIDPADSHRAAVCHVGDSRVYRVRAGSAELLTKDHTIGSQLSAFAHGRQADDLKSRTNPLAHVLTRAIGVGPDVAGDWRRLDLTAGDMLLTCSDGVHDVISDVQVGELLSPSKSLAEVADGLSKRIVECGAPDNYSFVLVQMEVQS